MKVKNLNTTDMNRISCYPHSGKISKRLDSIARREDDWDGYGSPKPTEATLDNAKLLLEIFLESVISAGYRWLTPFISSDEEGNVTAEWSRDSHRLHIQIGEDEAEYIQVWGPNIDTEMHVDFLTRTDYLPLWEWLLDEEKRHNTGR